MLNFKDVENRIKIHTGLSEGKDIAALFKMTPQNYSNKKSAGTLLPTVIAWAIQENVNLDWLIKGENPESEAKPIDRETRIINKILEEMTEEQKTDVRKYCEMSKCYEEMMALRKKSNNGG